MRKLLPLALLLLTACTPTIGAVRDTVADTINENPAICDAGFTYADGAVTIDPNGAPLLRVFVTLSGENISGDSFTELDGLLEFEADVLNEAAVLPLSVPEAVFGQLSYERETRAKPYTCILQ